MNTTKYLMTVLALVMSVGLTNCTKHSHDHESEAEEHHNHEHDADEIVLSQEKAKAAGVKVMTVEQTDFHGVIHTSGKVMAASCDETTVVATQSGRVTNMGHLSEGMHINSGMKLFSVTLADMQSADGDPVKHARIELQKTQRDYERAKELAKDQLITDKELQLTKADYEQARLTLDALQRTRSASGIVITAPKAGFVKQILVTDGDYVEAGQPLMVITQNQHLYLRAEVAERYFAELAHIHSAKFRTSYSSRLYDITEMGGHVQSYGRSAETGNAFIPVTFEFNNTGDVVQGSYADIYLITSTKHQCITVPVAALTEEQGLHYVYIQVDADGYRKQEVTLGLSDGERTEILTGLKGGEKVVVKGAIQVKLASASNAIPAHTHNH